MKSGSIEERQAAIVNAVRQECRQQRPQEAHEESNSCSVFMDIATAIGGLFDIPFTQPAAPTPTAPTTPSEKKKKKRKWGVGL
jgi:hypothetical protein